MQARAQLCTKSNQSVTSKENYEAMLCESEAVQRLNEVIQKSHSQKWTDEIILAVNSMLFTDRSWEKPAKVPSPFCQLFDGIQSLDICGFLTENNMHRRGLHTMIRQRGGLGNIQSDGVAAIICW
jgi:hypothetical protein